MKTHRMRCTWFLAVLFLLGGCASGPDPRDKAKAEAAREIGEAYLAKDQLPQAYREFQKAQELYPDDPLLHWDLGNFYLKKKKYDLAVASYRRALELNPDLAQARNNMGAAYLAKGDNRAAIKVLQELLDDNYLYTTPHYSYFLLGKAYYNLGRYPTARDYFQTALEESPEYFFARHWLGCTLLATGDHAEALKALEKTVEDAPKYGAAYLDLGRVYQAMHRYDWAEKAYRRAAALAPDATLSEQAEEALKDLDAIR